MTTDTRNRPTIQAIYWFLGGAIFIILGIVILSSGRRAWGVGELMVGLLWAGVALRARRCR
jgi:hypothetical protein